MFSSLAFEKVKRYNLDHFDVVEFKRNVGKEQHKVKLNIKGYSYGAWTALQLTHWLAHHYPDCFEIRIGTIDPVNTARGKTICVETEFINTQNASIEHCILHSVVNSRASNVVYGINYYQTDGGGGTPFGIGASLFIGSPVTGFDINQKETGLPENYAHTSILQRKYRELDSIFLKKPAQKAYKAIK